MTHPPTVCQSTRPVCIVLFINNNKTPLTNVKHNTKPLSHAVMLCAAKTQLHSYQRVWEGLGVVYLNPYIPGCLWHAKWVAS